jgi:hypothetical protein
MAGNFEKLIISAPLGFMGGCVELSKLDGAELESVIQQAIATSRRGQPSSDASSRECTKALMYIIYARNMSVPPPEVTEIASVLDSNTTLSRACITSLVSGLEGYPVPVASPSSTGNMDVTGEITGVETRRGGTLNRLQWRMGVSLASSHCRSLMSPFVDLSFTVTDPNGERKVHTAELTYKEFQSLHRSIKEVAARMDAL